MRNCITKNLIDGKPNSDNSLKEIIRHLRNAVAHGGLEIFGKDVYLKSDDNRIESITFKDKGHLYNRKTYIEFEINLSYDLLKNFLIEFATNICDQIESKEEN